MERKHTLKDWVVAVRPWSFPASAMPVIVSLAYLFAAHEDMDWFNGVWALVNIVIFHAAGNTRSDYFDFRKGANAEDTFGEKTLTSGLFSKSVSEIQCLGRLRDFYGIRPAADHRDLVRMYLRDRLERIVHSRPGRPDYRRHPALQQPPRYRH